MKTSYIDIGAQVRRTLGKVACAGVMAMFLTTTGCIFIDGDGYSDPPSHTNYPPAIYSAEVYCDFDYYYYDYYWDIYANVDDPDYDVTDVYAEIYDYYTGSYLETQDLAYDGGDQWSNRIYETYSNYLDCVFAEDFDFDIYAVDSYGEYDVVATNYIP